MTLREALHSLDTLDSMELSTENLVALLRWRTRLGLYFK